MNLDKYNDCFIRTLGANRESLNENYNFNAVPDWDSLAHLSLIEELEKTFDISLEGDDIMHFGGYENGKVILEKYGISMLE
ncbi:MAG: acyl carrier protein [Lachnospiraceae bacterium]|nr:acyl carrier protein [Lachnospiraceae bacterium]